MIDRSEGRRLFGLDPAGYDAARPGHHDLVYDVLVQRCGLGDGTAVLEVGPGTGQATRRLLELGADPLVVVEPNEQLAEHLEKAFTDRVEVRRTTLEDADLHPTAFDLAAAASSFHWVEETAGLTKIHGVLRPGGWVALWWTLFGDRRRHDAFMRATRPLLDGLEASPTKGRRGRPRHALDRKARVRALHGAGFVDVEHELVDWDASWDTEGIRGLYGSFSPILSLEAARRVELLDEIARIADEEFGGRVERTLTTSLYTAQRPTPT
jgi:SAM-dependent methyltransferase